MEELKYFKLELLNREENFNKMFGRSPTVGVMQVRVLRARLVHGCIAHRRARARRW